MTTKSKKVYLVTLKNHVDGSDSVVAVYSSPDRCMNAVRAKNKTALGSCYYECQAVKLR